MNKKKINKLIKVILFFYKIRFFLVPLIENNELYYNLSNNITDIEYNLE